MLAKLVFVFVFLGLSVSAFEDVCGVSPNVKKYEKLLQNNNPERILGGHPAKYGDWPWLISISNGCTGSLIHPQWAVCAKHCQIQAGTQIRYGTVKKTMGKVVDVTEVITIDNTPTINNEDIVLLKLAEPIKFSRRVHAICLATNLSKEIGSQEAVAGWGVNKYTEISPEQAYENTVPFQPSEFCLRPGKNELCAGSFNHGTTQGDSGGPMMALRNGKWFLHGVTSRGYYGNENGVISDHGVYTDVTAHCDWIEEQTNGDVKCQDDVFE